jgi:ribosomal protein S18 acetylase RimI-like enzyme
VEARIRRLDFRDAAVAVRTVQAFAARDVSPQHMERFLSNPANYLVVAEVNEELVGFLLAYALDRLKEDSHKMFIYEIEVAEGYRRQGIGSALISFVRDIVREEKMLSAFVFTNHSNEPAVEFYKHTGGKIENGDDLLFVYQD